MFFFLAWKGKRSENREVYAGIARFKFDHGSIPSALLSLVRPFLGKDRGLLSTTAAFARISFLSTPTSPHHSLAPIDGWLSQALKAQTSLLADLQRPLFFAHLQKSFALLPLQELTGTHLWTSRQTRFPRCLGSMRFVPSELAPSLTHEQQQKRAEHLQEEPLGTRSHASVRRREEKGSVSGLETILVSEIVSISNISRVHYNSLQFWRRKTFQGFILVSRITEYKRQTWKLQTTCFRMLQKIN